MRQIVDKRNGEFNIDQPLFLTPASLAFHLSLSRYTDYEDIIGPSLSILKLSFTATGDT